MPTRGPTPEELHAAATKRLPDVLRPGLDLVFCGINPSLYSAAVGHHFARPGNRFWPAVHQSGFTDRLLSPYEDRLLLEVGCGLTNIVARPTAAAEALEPEELRQGMRLLERKLRRVRPRAIVFLGSSAFSTALGRRHVAVGPQSEGLGGAIVWVLPNPSGRNAHYQLPEIVRLFRALRSAR